MAAAAVVGRVRWSLLLIGAVVAGLAWYVASGFQAGPGDEGPSHSGVAADPRASAALDGVEARLVRLDLDGDLRQRLDSGTAILYALEDLRQEVEHSVLEERWDALHDRASSLVRETAASLRTEPPPPSPGSMVGSPIPGGRQVVERFGSLEAPAAVDAGAEFTVLFSLTEQELAPGVQVSGAELGEGGRMRLDLPDPPEAGGWSVEVVLSAPRCEIRGGSNVAKVWLPVVGDSTPARFDLVAGTLEQSPTETRLHATLWHAGAFLGRVSRGLTIGSGPRAMSSARAASAARRDVGGATAAMDLRTVPADLTVFVRSDAAEPSRKHVTVASPLFQTPSWSAWDTSDLNGWLDAKLAQLADGVRRGRPPRGEQVALVDPTAMLRGLGRELFERHAPPAFRTQFFAVAERLGADFESIAIYSDDPRVPWELMRPSTPDGSIERDFLGVEFRIGRWHVSRQTSRRDRPPQSLVVEELVVVSPQYTGARFPPLQGQASEIEVLRRFPGYRSIPARRDELETVIRGSMRGILHFAGHGSAVHAAGAPTSFAVHLEDGAVDLTTWRGLSPARYRGNPLFFLNACEVGQTQRVADFVEGWAPAVLELGASGCLGALCPVGDAAAAEFSAGFYRDLGDSLAAGGVRVADVLRRARRERLDAGDPIGLAYVFYGDPELRLVCEPR